MESRNINFTPVFIEPTLKHSLLNIYKYNYIIIFEIIIVILLVYIFFKSEIIMLISYKDDISINPIDNFSKSWLSCDGNKLVINNLPNTNGTKTALAINRQDITYKDCNFLLQSINGSSKISLNDVLRRQ
ncbi:SPV061 hypothetical protein [Swinepox virus]|uniref:Uncharacterized protein n=1 Tax=Swinepox virus (strain Swine/Nebraska/17077-99/1999) TaxID=300880 RepID=Q8V3N3_SWPV1|nr:SPV061 hypothetical protein [Swinepox virus]AAL69800.1 SPV061 hypothetical protein [Swinepox virus]UUA44251.1 SPV061 [Swinepox virus]